MTNSTTRDEFEALVTETFGYCLDRSAREPDLYWVAEVRQLWIAYLAARRAALMEAAELREAAQAVIDQWDTPLWKNTEATAVFINRLRSALADEGAKT